MRAWLPCHDAFARKKRAQWHSARDSLRAGDDVRLDSCVLVGPPFASAAHARLHFVDDEHDSMLAANRLKLLQKELRRGHVTAFALNRLDDDPSHILGIKTSLEG